MPKVSGPPAPGVKKNKTMNKYAKGGMVRGAGAATKGKKFSGVC